MSVTICGHEREALRWALGVADQVVVLPEILPGEWPADDVMSVARGHNSWHFKDQSLNAELSVRRSKAIVAVCDPARLAEIMMELLRQFWAPPVYSVSVSWSEALNMRIVINADYNGRFGTVDGSHGWTMASARAITLKLLSCTSTDEALAALEAT